MENPSFHEWLGKKQKSLVVQGLRNPFNFAKTFSPSQQSCLIDGGAFTNWKLCGYWPMCNMIKYCSEET